MLSRACALSLLLLHFGGAPAFAQAPDHAAEHPTERTAGVGGEITAIAGPRDDLAFFNYTDYDRNGLRLTRLRLFAEWRPARPFAAVGEVRTENGADLTVPALYLRWRPAVSRDIVIHAGRIPPVIGGFPRHAYGRDNVVLGQPLAYQYLTSLRPDALPATADDLLRMRGRGWQPSYPLGATSLLPGIPLIAVSRWDTGVSGLWRAGVVDVAGAVTRGAPAIPVVEETNDGVMWSGRAAVRLPAGVTVGVSGARGQWLSESVLALLDDNRHRDSTQTVLGTDIEAGFGPWLVRSEWIHSEFDLPIGVASGSDVRLSAWSGFVEGRYRPHPRWQAGARVERLAFSPVANSAGAAATWDANVHRAEAVLSLRLSRHAELRGGWQHNWRAGGRVRERGLPIAALLYWF